MNPAHNLIVDAVRAGVLLIADGPRLRFKAIASLPPDLAAKLKVHRADVLALLRSKTPAPAGDPDAQLNAKDAPRGSLACLLATVRDAFAPFTLKVVGVRGDPSWPRNRAARLIRQARQLHGRDKAAALRDAFAERVAICNIEGGQDQRQAERIAVDELRNLALLSSK